MKHVNLWILVADGSRAHLFRCEVERDMRRGRQTPKRIESLRFFEHPKSRAHNDELIADEKGSKLSLGFGHGAGLDPRSDAKDEEAVKFARELGRVLVRGTDDHAFEELMIVAPPRFLGVLKGVLEPRVSRRVVATLVKDYAGWRPQRILHELDQHLAA